jgi:hypothetical protein
LRAAEPSFWSKWVVQSLKLSVWEWLNHIFGDKNRLTIFKLAIGGGRIIPMAIGGRLATLKTTSSIANHNFFLFFTCCHDLDRSFKMNGTDEGCCTRCNTLSFALDLSSMKVVWPPPTTDLGVAELAPWPQWVVLPLSTWSFGVAELPLWPKKMVQPPYNHLSHCKPSFFFSFLCLVTICTVHLKWLVQIKNIEPSAIPYILQ